MSNAYQLLFEPSSTDAVSLSASTTSARVALPVSAPTAEGLGNGTRRMVAIASRTSDADVYVRFGDSTVTATTAAGALVHGGQVRGFTVPVGATHVAAITASGTATVNIVPGSGF